ncbi:hypothetical protein PCANC_10270 [Puccinia coronata f. sp. avenae]|uniref:HMG box domain-containing protein n=1 Tax=Puccinia coronata f. sp. avenae TaxID=200324 RepID=A0A2N5VQB4_9BASI|nr:hypothetical protein PCANC_10270 [Puccinia coronata f. sp. avenae]
MEQLAILLQLVLLILLRRRVTWCSSLRAGTFFGTHPTTTAIRVSRPAVAAFHVGHPAAAALPGSHPATGMLPGSHLALAALTGSHPAAASLPGSHPAAAGNTLPDQNVSSVQSAPPTQKNKKKRGPYKKRKRQSSTGPTNTPAIPTLGSRPANVAAANTLGSGPANKTTAPTLGSNNVTGTNTATPNQSSTRATTRTLSQPRPTGDQVAQLFQDADHHIIRVAQAATCQNKRITNAVKDELRQIMLEYQKQVQLVALRSQIQAELLFKWLGVYNKSRTPNQFNNFCRYSPDARKIFALKEFPPSERMQQVADVWRELCEEDQLKFCNWDFINDLQIQMGLEPLDDPKALEPKDEAEEIDSNQPHPRNPATINTPKETVALPMSKKSNYEAESACNKWVNKAVRDKSNKRIKVTPQAKREPWDLGDYDKNNSAMLDQLRKLLAVDGPEMLVKNLPNGDLS